MSIILAGLISGGLYTVIALGIRAIIMNRANKFYGGRSSRIASEMRNDKARMYAARKNIAELKREVRVKKLENEYIIRGILASYFDFYIEFLGRIIKEIVSIQNDSYRKLKAIAENIGNNKEVSGRIPKRYDIINKAIHLKIHETKKIKDILLKQRNELIHKKKELVVKDYEYYRPHKKLGAKKLVKEILDGRKSWLLKEYKKKSIIEIGYLRLRAEKRCSKCGSYVIGKLRYCFVCGSIIDEKNSTKSIKIRKSKYDIICNNCGMPINNMWEYCPNCHNRFDHFGLRECLSLSATEKHYKKRKTAKGSKKKRRARCAAKTLSGKRCKRYAVGRSKYCAIHRRSR